MDELDTAVVGEGDSSGAVSETARKPKARSAPKWETEAARPAASGDPAVQ
jgi:hypothetical protein